MATYVYKTANLDARPLTTGNVVIFTGTSGTTPEGVVTGVKVEVWLAASDISKSYPVTVRLYTDTALQEQVATVTRTLTFSYADVYMGFTFTLPTITIDEAASLKSVLVVGASTYADNACVSLASVITATIEHAVISDPTAPTYVYTSSSTAAPGAQITLGWGGATSGDGASITGYLISRASSSSGPYTSLYTVSSTQTYGATTVIAPTTNGASYYYKVAVLAMGVDGVSRKATSSSYASVTCSYSSVTAPTSVKLSATNAAPGVSVTLSWSGASGGTNNDISCYGVYRATTAGAADDEYEFVAYTVNTYYAVTAPTEEGASYYYKVKTCGTLSGYDSNLSTAYAVLTCTVSAVGAPTKVSLASANGSSKAYVPAGSSIPLYWSGATAGVNNSIVGYYVYQDGSLYATVDSTETTTWIGVPAPATAGTFYEYTVATRGSYSDSTASASSATVFAYTDPTGPTSYGCSNDQPSADARITLWWSGAEPGGYNDITGYKVYRSTTEDGAKTQVSSVTTTEASASCHVRAPATVGGTYYFWVETVGEITNADMVLVATVTASKEAEVATDDTTVVVPKPTGYKKRGFLFGDYDTAANGWTLTGWEFPEPETQTNYISVPGRSAGPLDYSTALTDGDPRYGSRELTALFELSEGTRFDRNDVISEMVNELHGMQVEIVFPDDATRYAVGRLSVNTSYSDMAHAEVSVQATCEPWRYSKQETVVSLMAVEDEQTVVLSNAGRRIIVPDITVTGSRVNLHCGDHSWTLYSGTHRLPDLELRKGNTLLTYSGSATVTIKYREAIL